MKINARRLAVTCGALLVTTSLVACGGNGSDDTAAAGPDTVKVVAVFDRTGPAGYGGELEAKAVELGLEEMKASGDYDIEYEIKDSGSDLKQAVQLVNEAIKDDADVIMYGPWSSTALGLVPIAQRSKVPFIAVQSGSDGVVDAGDYIFRVSTSQVKFMPSVFDYLQEEGVKDIATINRTDNATLKEMGDAVPGLAKDRDMEVTNLGDATETQTDFKSLADKVVKQDPDALFLGTSGTQTVTAIQQIRQAGWEGLFVGTGGFAGGTLDPLGTKGDGIVYPVWYSPNTDLPVGKKFASDYQKKYKKEPLTFAGEAYDATLLLRNAMDKLEGDVTRESLRDGLTKASEDGFDGAQSEPLTFKDRDAQAKGFVLRRDDGVDKIVSQ